MVVYEAFALPEARRFKTHICTKASLVVLVTLFLTFIPPFFVVYRTEGFWVKEAIFRETPRVLFKKELILVLELEGSSEFDYITYSTYQRYNQLQQRTLRVPLIESREEDYNGDGRYDSLIFNLQMPLQDTENVVGVKLLMFFDYRLEKFVTLGMESMAFIQYHSIKPGAEYEVYGNLKFQQKQPLASRGTDYRYNVTIVNTTSPYAESYSFSTIFKTYSERNLTTYLQAPFTNWMSGRGSGQPFKLSANITYLEDVFLYKPNFWYMIKMGWVQYVSVLLLFIFCVNRVKAFIFQNQLVQTIVERPFKGEKGA